MILKDFMPMARESTNVPSKSNNRCLFIAPVPSSVRSSRIKVR